jgi:acetolactate synthase I/III small subunit
MMKHVLSAMVMNQPGVLAHISGMLASRAFNIESLAVGETEDPQFSRMTFVVAGDDKTVDQVRKQLEKIVTVVKVVDYQRTEIVDRGLILLKVATTSQQRTAILELVSIFRAKVVDVGLNELMIELSGQDNKLNSFIDLMRPYGIVELVRTGRIALAREVSMSVSDALKPPATYDVPEVVV